MSVERLDRESQSRAKSERKKSWAPASVMPDPDIEPGYTYRWVRVSIAGHADPKNLSKKLREGFEPVKKEEQPHLAMLTDSSSRFKDNIEIDGSLLCKRPVEMTMQRRAHYGRANNDQMKAVDNNFLRESDPRMPLFQERRSKVSFGKD